MKVVVAGGHGVIGSRIVARIRGSGHEAVAASMRSGFDALAGTGMAEALAGADVVIDALNAPESVDPLRFFSDSTRNLLMAGGRAGVRHHVVVSIVGVDRLGQTAYFNGKLAQERLVASSGIPFSIVRSTQFVEFIESIADAMTSGDEVRVPPIHLQPIAVDDAAAAVVQVALSEPVNRIVEVAGAQRDRLDTLVERMLEARHDPRRVITDPDALYFGAVVREDTLLPAR